MTRTTPPRARRRRFLVLSLGLACLCLVGLGAGSAEAQRYSSQFLDVLNEACFSNGVQGRSDTQPRPRSRVRVILANSRANDLSQICAYDLTCGEVAFSGRIERSRRVSFSVCADSRVRGHVLLLDPFGTLQEHRNLQSPATIRLGQ